MWPDDRIQNLFGIELPIIQAPLAGVAFSEIVVGVSEAGGPGSLACGLLVPQQTSPLTADAEREAARRRVLEGSFPNPKLGVIVGPLWIASHSLDAAP